MDLVPLQRLLLTRFTNLPAMQETRVQSLDWEDPLEKGMVTHSSILAWKIPWTKEPGGLQSIESERVRNDSNHLDAGIHFLGLRSWNQW